MRISDWSSDVCSSDLRAFGEVLGHRLDRRIDQRCAIKHRLNHNVGRQRGIDSIKPLRDRRGNGAAVFTDPHDRGADDDFFAVFRRGAVADRLPETHLRHLVERSAERRVGTEWVSTGRSRWVPYHSKKKQKNQSKKVKV